MLLPQCILLSSLTLRTMDVKSSLLQSSPLPPQTLTMLRHLSCSCDVIPYFALQEAVTSLDLWPSTRCQYSEMTRENGRFYHQIKRLTIRGSELKAARAIVRDIVDTFTALEILHLEVQGTLFVVCLHPMQ
jgi:hypothetical protein